MMKTQRALSWLPVREGVKYCAPACGRGCTWREFCAAKKAADILAKSLGPKWQAVVHENLGWYFYAKSPCGHIQVHQFNKTNFSAYLNASSYHVSESSSSARGAMRKVLRRVKQQRDGLTHLLEEVTQ